MDPLVADRAQRLPLGCSQRSFLAECSGMVGRRNNDLGIARDQDLEADLQIARRRIADDVLATAYLNHLAEIRCWTGCGEWFVPDLIENAHPFPSRDLSRALTDTLDPPIEALHERRRFRLVARRATGKPD